MEIYYRRTEPIFAKKAAQIRNDIPRRMRKVFDAAVKCLSGITPGEIMNGKGDKPGRHIVRETIRDVLSAISG